jgi:peroxiredoxin
MAITVGQKAPDFILYDTDKKKQGLQDYIGRPVVLLFFPFAFSSVCTAELCEVRDNIASYNAVNAQVLGLSVDSLYTLAKFKAEQHLDFPLLSDFNKTVSSEYGALYEQFSYGMKGVSKRAAFVIDKAGVVRYAEVLENASDVPNFAKIKETLAISSEYQ